MAKYAGADWLNRDDDEISPLGRRVADLLGQMFTGLYHLRPTAILKATWADRRCVRITLDRPLGTTDFNELTVLVVLCHDAAIRCELEGVGPRYTRLMFSQRRREGELYDRHPTMEEAVGRIRKALSIPELQGPLPAEHEEVGAERRASP